MRSKKKLSTWLGLGKCFRLRGRIDIARANQKPVFTYRGPITGCFRYSHQTLCARCNTIVHSVLDIATKIYTLDVILEYSSKARIVPRIQQAKQFDFDRDDTASACVLRRLFEHL